MKSNIVIVWSSKERTSGRSQKIADALGAEVIYIYHSTFLGLRIPTFIRYFVEFYFTFFYVLKHKPKLVIVQIPPIFAALPVLLIGKILRIKVLLDLHTSFQDSQWKHFHFLHKLCCRFSTFVTSHNEEDYKLISNWAPDHSIVLKSPAMSREDLIIDADYFKDLAIHNNSQYKTKILFVNRFAIDDPYKRIIELANLQKHLLFFITGNPDKVALNLDSLPDNVVMTGFIHPSKFLALMDYCDLVLSLTTRSGTLLWSIREALALQKPFVTSNHDILKNEFSSVGHFTDHSLDDLINKIDLALMDYDNFIFNANKYINTDKKRWDTDIAKIKNFIL